MLRGKGFKYSRELSVWMDSSARKLNSRPETLTVCGARLTRCISLQECNGFPCIQVAQCRAGEEPDASTRRVRESKKEAHASVNEGQVRMVHTSRLYGRVR